MARVVKPAIPGNSILGGIYLARQQSPYGENRQSKAGTGQTDSSVHPKDVEKPSSPGTPHEQAQIKAQIKAQSGPESAAGQYDARTAAIR